MAVLARVTTFAPGTIIQSAQMNAELNQIVNLLNGTSTGVTAIIRFSDLTNPGLTVEQLSTGAIQSWRASGTDKAKIRSDGSFQTAGAAIYDFNVNALLGLTSVASAVNQLTLANAATGTGPTLSATGTDTNIPINITPKGTGLTTVGGLAATRPRFTTSIDDSNGNQWLNITATASAVNQLTLANAATGNAPILSATGSDTNIGININPKGTGDVKGTFLVGHGFVAQASGSTDSPLCGLANSSGSKNGEFGLALGTGNFSTIAAIGDFVLRSGGSSAGNMIFTAFNGGDIKFATAAATSDTLKQKLKNNGFWVGLPQNIKTDSSTAGNSTTTLTDLHTFTLPAGSLNANGDYLRVRYSGLFAANANTKRIVILFGGQVAHDPGLFDQRLGVWVYDIIYLRLSATSVRVTLHLAWNGITRDGAAAETGNGLLFAAGGDLTVSDLGANSTVMKVQGQGGATNDVQQNFSIIEQVQNT